MTENVLEFINEYLAAIAGTGCGIGFVLGGIACLLGYVLNKILGFFDL